MFVCFKDSKSDASLLAKAFQNFKKKAPEKRARTQELNKEE
jgi:hypothetical protein